MRAKAKVAYWCAITAVALAAGVIVMKTWGNRHKAHDWERNEVVCCLLESSPSIAYLPNLLWVDDVFYIEKKASASGKKVFFSIGEFAQNYIIENDTVKNYHWGLGNQRSLPLKDWLLKISLPVQPYDNEQARQIFMGRSTALPVKVPQSTNETEANIETTSITYVWNSWMTRQGDHFSESVPPREALKILRWSGEANESPDVVSEFYQAIAAEVNKPEYAGNNPLSWRLWKPKVIPYDPLTRTRKHTILWDSENRSYYGYRIYPSYLRAVPLSTEEELEQVKDVLLLDYDSAGFHIVCGVQSPDHKHNAHCARGSYHITCAVRAPYLLIPVPEKGSLFPFLEKEYEPGQDKVIVKLSLKGQGFHDVYFLVETFKGERWGN